MNTMKAAQLTSRLLARKGTAGPSSPRNTEATVIDIPAPPQLRKLAKPAGDRAPQGGGDKTKLFARPKSGLAASRTSHAAVGAGPKSDHRGRVKLSLRLDRERHTRLRLFAAHTERHLQDILTAALDEYLDRHKTASRGPGPVRPPAKGGSGSK